MITLLNPRLLALRGALSLAFGILALIWPGPSLLAIAVLFGVYAFVDGVLAVAAGVRRHRGLPLVEGLVGIAAGVLTFLWPGITLLVLSILVGAWALVSGLIELVAAFTLGHRQSRGARGLLFVAGLLSVALGAAIFVLPILGAIALLTFVASYSIFFGIALLALGTHLVRQPQGHAPEIEVSKKAA